MNQFKERPILFSAPMVRAILAGNKTQTRRAIRNVGNDNCIPHRFLMLNGKYHNGRNHVLDSKSLQYCPYGQPGDRLWVRETWAPCGTDVPGEEITIYKATDKYENEGIGTTRWYPSIHMHRHRSRILLEIVSVRAERLHDITESDAQAEGVALGGPIGHLPSYLKAPYTYHYAQLWDSINGPGSWEANPWVWVIEFKRVEPTK